jgi:uncharacterized protein RhaS with RHS repeats
VYYGFRFYDPNLQRWVNRDPAGERASWNLFQFTSNAEPNHIDALGLDVPNPPDDIGFTYGDIFAAFRMADEAGITGPDGQRMLALLQEMLASDKTVAWKKLKNNEIPETTALVETKAYPGNATISFPKCDPHSLKKDIRGKANTRYYFHAAIMHEMIHAYQDMKGQAGHTEEEQEKEPRRIGDALNNWLDRNLR